MSADGGLSVYSGNKVGAKYGTGYCDAQCLKDIKFINGEANMLGQTLLSNDINSRTSQYGTCYNKLDVWEADSMDTAYTPPPHPCTVQGKTRCSADQCTSYCDQAGCDFNSFRMGNQTFFGKGMTVDSSQKVTVVTQFITSPPLNGKVIQNSKMNIAGMSPYDLITEAFCSPEDSFR
ncbi:hypothetical protein FRC10_012130 [Ceratobasidium sp. 414]|nr:hypothetical protein FRC10_012130 [Ceratobasidium sp. 414]